MMTKRRALLECYAIVIAVITVLGSTNAFAPTFRRKNAFFSTRTTSRIVLNDAPNNTAVLDWPYSTVQDVTVDAPASVVFYDDVLDESLPDGVVCARGICVLEDFDESTTTSVVNAVLNSYWGPRLLLAGASILYGTNFPLGRIMNDALPPSAATSARMVLAALALSPFLFQLNPKLRASALLCGCFTALGYITQSLALVDTSPATVAFLGAATVIVCPTLEALVNQKPMGLKDAPQTWLAAVLCLTGVGILELYDPTGSTTNPLSHIGWGDFLSILQAVGFGTSFFLTERMMRGQPHQALPITAVQVSTTAFLCMLWCLADGWVFDASTTTFALPQLFWNPTIVATGAAFAVAWTGVVTTALNRFVETTALGKLSSAEASVILATEPLWAALFAAILLKASFGVNDYVGGALIVLACLANTLEPTSLKEFLNIHEAERIEDNNKI